MSTFHLIKKLKRILTILLTSGMMNITYLSFVSSVSIISLMKKGFTTYSILGSLEEFMNVYITLSYFCETSVLLQF